MSAKQGGAEQAPWGSASTCREGAVMRWFPLVATAAALAGLLAPAGVRAEDGEEQAVQALERLHARVHRAEDVEGHPVDAVILPNDTRVTDQELEVLGQFKHLQFIDIGGPVM